MNKHCDTQNAWAFGCGCDARLAGLPPTACPHQTREPDGSRLAVHWQAGYKHVADHWGKGVKGRWAFRPLCRVFGGGRP